MLLAPACVGMRGNTGWGDFGPVQMAVVAG